MDFNFRLDVQCFLWSVYYIGILYYVGSSPLFQILGCNYDSFNITTLPTFYCMQGVEMSIVVPDLVEEVVQFILIVCPALEESLLYWTVSKMMR